MSDPNMPENPELRRRLQRDHELLASVRRAREAPTVARAEAAAEFLDKARAPYYACDRKLKIRTPEHAQELADGLSARHGHALRPYFCVFCETYHLTSKEGM